MKGYEYYGMKVQLFASHGSRQYYFVLRDTMATWLAEVA